MDYSVTTVGSFYKEGEHLENLRELGFEFESTDFEDYDVRRVHSQNITVKIESLKDLRKFVDKYGSIILKEEKIIIYDEIII